MGNGSLSSHELLRAWPRRATLPGTRFRFVNPNSHRSSRWMPALERGWFSMSIILLRNARCAHQRPRQEQRGALQVQAALSASPMAQRFLSPLTGITAGSTILAMLLESLEANCALAGACWPHDRRSRHPCPAAPVERAKVGRRWPLASIGYKPPAPEVFVPAFAAWPAALRRPAPPPRWRNGLIEIRAFQPCSTLDKQEDAFLGSTDPRAWPMG